MPKFLIKNSENRGSIMKIKYIIIIAVLLLALTVSKSYCKFVDSSLAKARSIYSFLLHIERKLNGYMTPVDKLCVGYDDVVISKMLERLRGGSSLYDAYSAERADIPEKADEVLCEYFAEFGKCDLKAEIARTRGAISDLDKAIKYCKEDSEKNKRLCMSALPSIAFGIVILLI